MTRVVCFEFRHASFAPCRPYVKTPFFCPRYISRLKNRLLVSISLFLISFVMAKRLSGDKITEIREKKAKSESDKREDFHESLDGGFSNVYRWRRGEPGHHGIFLDRGVCGRHLGGDLLTYRREIGSVG